MERSMTTVVTQVTQQDRVSPAGYGLRRRLGRSLVALGASLLAGGFTPALAQAAERIELTFGALGLSIEMKSLEDFVATGEISDELEFYTRFLTPDQLAQVRSALTDRLDINLLAVSQFFNAPQGETILRRLAQVIRTGRNLQSVPALRAAIVRSAADPEGLTPLNLLRYYPTPSMRVDLAQALSLWRQIEETTIHQDQATTAVETAFAAQAGSPITPPPFELRQPGPYATAKTNRVIQPRDRRPFAADLYWPLAATGDRPVVVISHGLGSDRRTYGYLGEHLASHGFIAILLEHPGSDSRYIQALINGEASEAADPREFISRPADVRDILNELETNPQAPGGFTGAIDLDRTAVVGQSFGGYTALASAGAPLNFKRLKTDCASDDLFWNTSLLLQCRALVVRPTPDTDYLSLQDARVKAVVAISPITSSLFGREGIAQLQVPTAILSASNDPIALPLSEQLRPFAQMSIADKYLLVLRGGTHFSTLGATGDETVQLPASLVGPRPDLARDYTKAFITAFLKRYLGNDHTMANHLTPQWANSVSQPELPLYLLSQLSIEQLPRPVAHKPTKNSRWIANRHRPDQPIQAR